MKRTVAVLAAPLLAAAVAAGPALAATGRASTLPAAGHSHVVIPFAANQSQNWSGYNQGTAEQGGKQFNAISGNWTVPAVSQHVAGQAEYSSNWIGIGGGCVDAGCTVTDATLIQTGTEQDVSRAGKTSYSAWWEIIPEPETKITTMAVRPGDRMHANIAEAVPGSEVWTITLQDLTTGKSFSTTTPYSSSHLTAEWIEERPTLISSSGTALAPLAKATAPVFDLATTNGAPAGLKTSEEIQMTNSSGHVIAVPSGTDADTDGFNVCTYATACSAPTAS